MEPTRLHSLVCTLNIFLHCIMSDIMFNEHVLCNAVGVPDMRGQTSVFKVLMV